MGKTFDEVNELFSEAQKKLSFRDLCFWLSFVYGAMMGRMTEKDLKLFRGHLKNFESKSRR